MTLQRVRTEEPTKNWVPLMRGEEVVEYPADQATLTKRYTEEAVRFIREHRSDPFFVYLPHTMPHIPLFASDDFRGKSPRGLYGDVIEEIDWSVGQILATLDELGLDEKTLVVFTSDNGPWLSFGKHGGSALPLRDGKFTVYEGGMRMPCIMRWPGRVPPGTTCSEVAATIDLLPTFAELAGGRLPADRVLDGKSIWPLMSGAPGAKSPHETYFFRDRAVRAGDWKLHRAGGRRTQGNTDEKAGVELYNLQTDLSEKHNVAADHPDVVERLLKLLDEHRGEIARNKRPAGKVETSATE
jgi:arylsulfatase A-like enzyme